MLDAMRLVLVPLLLSLLSCGTVPAPAVPFCHTPNASATTTPSASVPMFKPTPTPILLACPPLEIATTTTNPSFRICLRPAFENDYVSTMIQKHGVWEPINTARIVNLLTLQKSATPQDLSQHVVVDVGAHLGWYTLLAASHGFTVVAFEPLRAQRERLQASVLLNGFQDLVTIMPFAVSNMAGLSTVWTSNGVAVVNGNDNAPIHHANTGASWIRPKGWTAHEAAAYAQVAEKNIETVLLDHALAALHVDKIFLVKMDIEGHLGLALSQGERTLQRATFLFVELTPKIEALNGCNVTLMTEALFHHGFRLCYPPKCVGRVCGVADIAMGEMETCWDDMPTQKELNQGGSDWVWAYKDMLLAKIKQPTLQ
jgi:FkbM family methyltransferase